MMTSVLSVKPADTELLVSSYGRRFELCKYYISYYGHCQYSLSSLVKTLGKFKISLLPLNQEVYSFYITDLWNKQGKSRVRSGVGWYWVVSGRVYWMRVG